MPDAGCAGVSGISGGIDAGMPAASNRLTGNAGRLYGLIGFDPSAGRAQPPLPFQGAYRRQHLGVAVAAELAGDFAQGAGAVAVLPNPFRQQIGCFGQGAGRAHQRMPLVAVHILAGLVFQMAGVALQEGAEPHPHCAAGAGGAVAVYDVQGCAGGAPLQDAVVQGDEFGQGIGPGFAVAVEGVGHRRRR